jgi:hypothetical protein
VEPAKNATSSRNDSEQGKIRRLPAMMLAGLLAMLLAACGSTQLGIMPSEAGNFVLRYTPADAYVVVAEEGFKTSGVTPSGYAAGAQAEEGVKRYELKPGRYKVTVSKAGYLTFEDHFEIAAGEAEGEGAELNLHVELDIDPNPPSDPGSVIGPSALSLRGNPNFDRSQLSSDQRLWYDRLWTAIDRHEDADAWAASNDTYRYGRYLNLHFAQLMLALRAAGDLRFLDEIDRLAQKMASKLDDTDGDGYENWIYQHGDNDKYVGKDVHEMDDGLTHSSIAAVMYAFHVNRDLPSPSGVDYGARADFWFDYLKNNYEAKWRERNDQPIGFPFTGKNLAHARSNFIRFYYYMGKVSGDSSYIEWANHLAKVVDDNFVTTKSPSGDSFIWCHNTEGCLYAQPTNYARYTVMAVLELALEGVHDFDSEGYLERLANGVTGFIVDNGAKDLAPDIAGNVEREGIPIRDGTEGDRDRIEYLLPLSVLAAYDHTGELAEVAMKVYSDMEPSIESPRNIEIPVAMLLLGSN